MSVTQRERDLYRPRWRVLTMTAIGAAAKPGATSRDLDQLARGAKEWTLPTPERDAGLILVALIHTARAFSAQTSGTDRSAIAPALATLAAAAGDILDLTAPGEPEIKRTFRADIDG